MAQSRSLPMNFQLQNRLSQLSNNDNKHKNAKDQNVAMFEDIVNKNNTFIRNDSDLKLCDDNEITKDEKGEW